MKSKSSLLAAFKNKQKVVAMLAPSFVVDFDYPLIISQLKAIGFDKVVELTFGAKLVNKEYHKILENSTELKISSVCPGIVEAIKVNYPQYAKNLMPVVSPMVATAMMCKKVYPKHKTCFISPCNNKKVEAEKSKYVDYVINYSELKELIDTLPKNIKSKKEGFDMFYNEYTRIYPISGGLTKTAHIKGVLNAEHAKVLDGWQEIQKFLKNPDKNIKFLDITFCQGGCIGGPFTTKALSLEEKRKKVLAYLELSKNMTIPKSKKGILSKAKGLDFSADFTS